VTPSRRQRAFKTCEYAEVPIRDTHTAEVVWTKGIVSQKDWIAPDGRPFPYVVSLDLISQGPYVSTEKAARAYTSAREAEHGNYLSDNIVYVPVDSDQYIREPAQAALRFREKDEVECFVRGYSGQPEWFPGVVLRRPACLPDGMSYMVDLTASGRCSADCCECSTYITVHADLERYIRRRTRGAGEN
jgi:hypothetical protein